MDKSLSRWQVMLSELADDMQDELVDWYDCGFIVESVPSTTVFTVSQIGHA
jgi:hypothetical protein